jgi:predicted nucleic acid-binding protein
MRSFTNEVFVDTGAFIALLSDSDRHHEEADRTYAELLHKRCLLYSTNHIVDETCSWLLRDRASGHRAALRFGETISTASVPATVHDLPQWLAERKMILLYSTPEVESLAWEILARYDTAGLSYTDCVSFAVMQLLRIGKAFTFDSHFDMMGFERL